MRAGSIAAMAACASALAGAAGAGPEVISIRPVTLPNYAGFGIGGAPEFIGSDEYTAGAAPVARYSWGNRYVDLQGNYLSSNLIDHERWHAGPAALLRFGRKDPSDRVVDRLDDVDRSLDLGAFVSYVRVNPDEPRDRWAISADFVHDVTGEHSGATVAASLRKWFPVARYGLFGLSLGSSYGTGDYMDTYFSVTPKGTTASGLPRFTAGAGIRDVRLTAAFVHPLSRTWIAGAGAMYMRLLGDAADTPITDLRGSPDQFVFGFGVARIF